jgi:hypothetical protein
MTPDPQFMRILFRVLIVALPIGLLGAAALVVAYRAFGPSKEPARERDTRAVAITGGAIAFILLACVVLVLLSTEWR